MEEDFKALEQSLEIAEEGTTLDSEINHTIRCIKKYKCYSVAVWVMCVITFLIKFVI